MKYTNFGVIGQTRYKTMFEETYMSTFPYDKSLLLWVTVKGDSGATYYIVSDQFRKEYYLWKDKRKTAKKSANPLDLYKYVK